MDNDPLCQKSRKKTHLTQSKTANIPQQTSPYYTADTSPGGQSCDVLYDSGPGDDRMILMGCAELLDGLAQADLWLAHGTFKVVPNVFFQLYSIHFDFGSGIHPAALYCLLTNKTSSTYNRVLAKLQRQIPRATPRTILVDFEKAAMSAFSGAHPDATVTGCYNVLFPPVSEWDSAGHPAPESTVSVGYDWSKPTVRKKISCTERSCCASSSL